MHCAYAAHLFLLHNVHNEDCKCTASLHIAQSIAHSLTVVSDTVGILDFHSTLCQEPFFRHLAKRLI